MSNYYISIGQCNLNGYQQKTVFIGLYKFLDTAKSETIKYIESCDIGSERMHVAESDSSVSFYDVDVCYVNDVPITDFAIYRCKLDKQDIKCIEVFNVDNGCWEDFDE